ncbi:Glucan endo-1 like protein [Verticillium longisporum]|nr:Glucan endo-1 like protein [Verticillium longisporum]
MQFLTFLFALTASAATITPNGFTKAWPGGVDNVIVTEANTLNGTVNSEIGPARAPLLGNLPLSLVNNFSGGSLNAYISGLDSNGAVVFLAADGSLVYPTSGGSSVPVPIGADIAIPLPPRGQTLRITLPIALSSGRVYFAAGKLNFFMVFTGSGDGLVQPSINNLQDPSAGLNWGFVELTLTPKGVIWANISFVDFVGLVFGMRLVDRDGRVQEVLGLPAGAVDSICNELRAQGDVDGRPWAAHCIEGPTGRPLRVVSPNNYATINPGAFADYWTVYADEVWRRVQEVLGLPAGAVDSICNKLRVQGDIDGRPWAAHCIEGPTGGPLRVVSPNNYATINPGAFADYWTVYADEAWRRYANQPLYINTQNENGVVECRVTGDTLSCDGDNRGYAKPEAVDIWGCNSGPFGIRQAVDIWGCNSGPFGIRQGDNAVHYAVVPRLCAAFVRTTLLLAGGDLQPGVDARDYYMQDPTSHYSRVVHEQEVDGRGYAFPYDDVNPDGAEDAAGLVASGNFDVLNFFIGGV